jgi:hypothetical protein
MCAYVVLENPVIERDVCMCGARESCCICMYVCTEPTALTHVT